MRIQLTDRTTFGAEKNGRWKRLNVGTKKTGVLSDFYLLCRAGIISLWPNTSYLERFGSADVFRNKNYNDHKHWKTEVSIIENTGIELHRRRNKHHWVRTSVCVEDLGNKFLIALFNAIQSNLLKIKKLGKNI